MAENSTKIKQRILQIAEFKKINKDDFLTSINQTYGNYKGKSKLSIPSADVIAEISTKYPEISIEWILTGDGEITKEETKPKEVFKLRTDNLIKKQGIPLYNIEASAGLVDLFQNYTSIKPVDTIHIPNLPKCDGAVYVTGDSMYPLLKSGDIIAYKEIKNFKDNIYWGQMYLISVDMEDDEFVAVKYIQKSEKGESFVLLVSKNSHHQAKDIPLSKIRALALIKATVRIN